MKILEIITIIFKKNQNPINPCANNENNENHRSPYENNENHKNHRNPYQNH